MTAASSVPLQGRYHGPGNPVHIPHLIEGGDGMEASPLAYRESGLIKQEPPPPLLDLLVPANLEGEEDT